MNRMLKVGIALAAVMALSAVMASAALATFNSSAEHTILSGSQREGTLNVFTATGGFAGVTCEIASFSGTAASKSASSQEISPTYSECEDSLGRKVDIDNSSLAYTFTVTGTNTNEEDPNFGTPIGTVHITGSIKMTITNAEHTKVVCTDTVSAQEGVNGITYHNTGGTAGLLVTSKSTNVKNTTEGGLLNCGVGNGEHTTGTYEGEAVITGVDTEGEPAEISVSVP